MKKIILLICAITLSATSFAQPTEEQKKEAELKAREEAAAAKEAEAEKSMEMLEQRMKEMEAQMKAMEKEATEKAKEAEEAAEGAEIPEVPEIPEIPETHETSEVEEEGDTTRIKWGNNTMEVIEKDDDVEILTYSDSKLKTASSGNQTISLFQQGRNRVFNGFEFGFSTISYTENELDTDVPAGLEWTEVNTANSINWALNFLEADIRIINEYVKFSTGLGYNVKNFSLRNDSTVTKINDQVIGIDEGLDYERNRLRTAYITVPAIIHFHTNKNPEKAFHIGAGVVGGMQVFQTYKTKTHVDGQKFKTKTTGSWNTNSFILDAKAMIGFAGVNVYANYSLTPLFEDNRGPEMYPVSFGISFINNYN